MKRSPRAMLAPILLASLVLACCAPKAAADGPTKANPRLKTAAISVGKASLVAELARTPAEREAGLMFRRSLKEGEGMLFAFEADQRLAFWMKNTSIPLSIAYIASDGTIRQILDLEPHSLEAKGSERSVRYALEVPRGWFERSGVAVGDRVLLPPLDE